MDFSKMIDVCKFINHGTQPASHVHISVQPKAYLLVIWHFEMYGWSSGVVLFSTIWEQQLNVGKHCVVLT